MKIEERIERLEKFLKDIAEEKSIRCDLSGREYYWIEQHRENCVWCRIDSELWDV